MALTLPEQAHRQLPRMTLTAADGESRHVGLSSFPWLMVAVVEEPGAASGGLSHRPVSQEQQGVSI
jgi:hypothetical protein